jgi:hypothetical protein
MDQHLDFIEFRENGELLLGTSSLNRRLAQQEFPLIDQ